MSFKMKPLLVAAILCGTFAGTSGAATFTAGLFACPASTFPDEPSLSSSSGVSVSCGSVLRGDLEATGFAISSPGTLSAYASAFASRLEGVLVVNTGTARTFATFSDKTYVNWRDTGAPVSVGSAVFEVDVLGSTLGGGLGTASLSIDNVSIYSLTNSGAGISDEVILASAGFQNGEFGLQGAVTAWAAVSPPTVETGTNYTEVDFGSSLRLTGLSILDDQGNDITSLVDVVSESGFDYVRGVAPHDRGGVPEPAVIPLPASGLLMMGSLLGLVAGARSRTRKARRGHDLATA